MDACSMDSDQAPKKIWRGVDALLGCKSLYEHPSRNCNERCKPRSDTPVEDRPLLGRKRRTGREKYKAALLVNVRASAA